MLLLNNCVFFNLGCVCSVCNAAGMRRERQIPEVGADNQTQVLWETSKHSWAISSTPPCYSDVSAYCLMSNQKGHSRLIRYPSFLWWKHPKSFWFFGNAEHMVIVSSHLTMWSSTTSHYHVLTVTWQRLIKYLASSFPQPSPASGDCHSSLGGFLMPGQGLNPGPCACWMSIIYWICPQPFSTFLRSTSLAACGICVLCPIYHT